MNSPKRINQKQSQNHNIDLHIKNKKNKKKHFFPYESKQLRAESHNTLAFSSRLTATRSPLDLSTPT